MHAPHTKCLVRMRPPAGCRRTRAFALESRRESISGRFMQCMLSRSRDVGVPAARRCHDRKNVGENSGTDQANVPYSLLRLERLSRPPQPRPEDEEEG